VKIVNGTWHCALCGADLGLLPAERPRTMIVGSAGHVNVRTVTFGRREIHRCESSLDSLQDSPAFR
jgi:hypothetical protein